MRKEQFSYLTIEYIYIKKKKKKKKKKKNIYTIKYYFKLNNII